MKRVFGCGLLTALMVGALVLSAAWMLRCYQACVQAEIELESGWTEIETLCRQRENLVPALTATLRGLRGSAAAGLRELEEANAAASGLVLSPEILHEPQRLDEFARVQQALSVQIATTLNGIRDNAGLSRQPTLSRLVTRLQACEERREETTERFNRAAAGFNQRIETFPDSLVAELFGIRTMPQLPTSEAVTDGKAR